MNGRYSVCKLCVECKKIYKISYFDHFMLGTFLVFFVFLFISLLIPEDSYFYDISYVIILIGLFAFLVGLEGYYKSNKITHNCKACNGKKTLINVDTPEAIELIKEYNIFYPEESPEDNKYPWEKNLNQRKQPHSPLRINRPNQSPNNLILSLAFNSFSLYHFSN